MVRLRKPARNPKQVEALVDTTPEMDSVSSSASSAATSISKAEAVRQAMSQGLDAPGDIADYIQSKYGLVMPKTQISSYKAQAKARARRKGSREKAKATTASQLLEDIETVKGLVDKLGADQVKRLADLFD
jgi:hypothetical protein